MLVTLHSLVFLKLVSDVRIVVIGPLVFVEWANEKRDCQWRWALSQGQPGMNSSVPKSASNPQRPLYSMKEYSLLVAVHAEARAAAVVSSQEDDSVLV